MANSLPGKQITNNVFNPLLSFISTLFRAMPDFSGKVKVAAGILLAIFCLEVQGQTIRYVKQGGNGNGSSWTQAYGDLQEAINEANAGDMIFVAGGYYRPNRVANNPTVIVPDHRDNAFVLKAHVKIYGGFSGWETSLSQRRLHPSNRSVLDGGQETVQAYHVVISAGNVGSTELNGFTIRNGKTGDLITDGSLSSVNGYSIPRGTGAGIHIRYSSPIIANCIFEYNQSNYASHLSNDNSSPSILNCTFRSAFGGGFVLHNSPNSSPTIVNSLFILGDLTAHGGFSNQNNSNPSIINCTFINKMSQTVNTIWNSFNSSPGIYNSIFYGHQINHIRNSDEGNSPKLANNLIQGSGGSADWNSSLGIDEGNNLDADPLFTDPDIGDYTLQPSSPAVNSGNNGRVPTGILTDMNGVPRVQFAIVDMGAYEANSQAGPDAEHIASENTETSGWQTANGQTYYATDSNTLIAGLEGDGSETAVTGEVAVKVWVQTTQPTGYVKRHYEILPANNPSTSTGVVTLYFTQQEFDDFNAANPTKLPQGPDDTDGKANLRIEKRGGLSSDGTGTPSSYTGGTTTIVPDQVAWNAGGERWEITFSVTGFSGFFVKTQSGPLPVNLITFTGQYAENMTQLSWSTAEEVSFNRFEIEKSVDGSAFNLLGNVPAKGTDSRYRYSAMQPEAMAYYRLKMVDLDGSYAYSNLVSVRRGELSAGVRVFPNPVVERLFVESTGEQILEVVLTDLNGRVVFRSAYGFSQGIDIKDRPAGVYLVKVVTASGRPHIRKLIIGR